MLPRGDVKNSTQSDIGLAASGVRRAAASRQSPPMALITGMNSPG